MQKPNGIDMELLVAIGQALHAGARPAQATSRVVPKKSAGVPEKSSGDAKMNSADQSLVDFPGWIGCNVQDVPEAG